LTALPEALDKVTLVGPLHEQKLGRRWIASHVLSHFDALLSNDLHVLLVILDRSKLIAAGFEAQVDALNILELGRGPCETCHTIAAMCGCEHLDVARPRHF